MTVEQLILKLMEYDMSAPVMIPGYEGGYNLVGEIKEIDVAYMPQPWCGDYDHDCDIDNDIHAVLLRRGVSK